MALVEQYPHKEIQTIKTIIRFACSVSPEEPPPSPPRNRPMKFHVCLLSIGRCSRQLTNATKIGAFKIDNSRPFFSPRVWYKAGGINLKKSEASDSGETFPAVIIHWSFPGASYHGGCQNKVNNAFTLEETLNTN